MVDLLLTLKFARNFRQAHQNLPHFADTTHYLLNN